MMFARKSIGQFLFHPQEGLATVPDTVPNAQKTTSPPANELLLESVVNVVVNPVALLTNGVEAVPSPICARNVPPPRPEQPKLFTIVPRENPVRVIVVVPEPSVLVAKVNAASVLVAAAYTVPVPLTAKEAFVKEGIVTEPRLAICIVEEAVAINPLRKAMVVEVETPVNVVACVNG